MKHTYASDISELELKSRGETFLCLSWVVLGLKYATIPAEVILPFNMLELHLVSVYRR